VAKGLSRACFPKPKQFLNQGPHFNHIAVFKPKIHISITLGVVDFKMTLKNYQSRLGKHLQKCLNMTQKPLMKMKRGEICNVSVQKSK
jgi:hypothetical protein